jgi:Luciferase-like monooxygenase
LLGGAELIGTLEFGLDTFVPVTVDEDGLPIDSAQAIRNTVEEAVLAETVGIDSFNVGEHYRPEFMDSAGHVILAAIAGRTERIRLGTAVTVLSTQTRSGSTPRPPRSTPSRTAARS